MCRVNRDSNIEIHEPIDNIPESQNSRATQISPKDAEKAAKEGSSRTKRNILIVAGVVLAIAAVLLVAAVAIAAAAAVTFVVLNPALLSSIAVVGVSALVAKGAFGLTAATLVPAGLAAAGAATAGVGIVATAIGSVLGIVGLSLKKKKSPDDNGPPPPPPPPLPGTDAALVNPAPIAPPIPNPAPVNPAPIAPPIPNPAPVNPAPIAPPIPAPAPAPAARVAEPVPFKKPENLLNQIQGFKKDQLNSDPSKRPAQKQSPGSGLGALLANKMDAYRARLGEDVESVSEVEEWED